jgi:hypothetical protein
MITLNATGVYDPSSDKANPNVRHKYTPDVSFHIKDGKGKWNIVRNLELPEDEQVYVICDHITIADGDKYNRVKLDNTISVFGVDIWRDKVVELHNYGHPTEDRELKAKELLGVYGEASGDALALMIDVIKHLKNAGDLTEDETKN